MQRLVILVSPWICSLLLTTASAESPTLLSRLARITDAESRRASSYDRTGGNGDNRKALAPGETYLLLDTDGPGKLTHLWMTVSEYVNHAHPLRDLVLRFYWENSPTPSVEVPLGDFFGMGHGRMYQVHASTINVGSNVKAMNCYWPMPFYKHARVELVNTGQRSIRRIYYNLDYEVGNQPAGQGLFHAEFRRQKELESQEMVGNTHGQKNYVLLDAKGHGHYVGCFLYVDSAPGGWWGEGDEMIFLDGEDKPSIVGTGTEDYFGNAWGFDRVSHHPYYGTPLLDKLSDGWSQTAVYRLHVPDPVRFKDSIRVTMEQSWHGGKKYDYSSVAYWYQNQPAKRIARTPPASVNQPRNHEKVVPAKYAERTICGTELEPSLRASKAVVHAVTTGHRDTYGGGYLVLEEATSPVTAVVAGLAPGRYSVTANLAPGRGEASFQGVAPDSEMVHVAFRQKHYKKAELGVAEVGQDGQWRFTIHSQFPVGIDSLRFVPQ